MSKTWLQVFPCLLALLRQAHEQARRPLAELQIPRTGTVVVVVGPEGGLTDGEVVAFRAAGAQAVRLGAEVLRTSTAGAAALAALSMRSRWT